MARPAMIRRLFPSEDFIVDWRLVEKNAGDIDIETLNSVLLDGELVRKEVAGALAAGETAELGHWLEAECE